MASDEWLRDTLLALTGSADIKVAAELMAQRELKETGFRFSSIVEVAARHDILPLVREMSYGPSGSVERSGERFVISLRMGESEARRRFTLAHELGHILIARAAGRELRDTTGQKTERFLDEFAGRLLLSPQQLVDWAQKVQSGLSIENLERGAREMLVSIRLLVKRLGECGLLDTFRRGVIIGAVARSRKAKKEPALRIHQVATPSWGFLPLNRRFSSIGFNTSEQVFFEAERNRATTGIFVTQSEIMVKWRPDYNWKALKTLVEQKVYRLRSGEQFVLVVFDWEPRALTEDVPDD